MEGHGIHIQNTLDPPQVQVGDRFFRDTFDQRSATYQVGVFSANETKNYIVNRIVADNTSGTVEYGEHLKHKPWCRKHPCCAVWTPNPPIQVFETEIKELGKALRATQVV